jgi:hypothetical protein
MRQRSPAKRRPVIVIGVVGLVVICTLLLLLISAPLPAVSDSKPQLVPWAFPGAYANYSGSTIVLGRIRCTMNYTVKVLAVEGTKAEVLSQMRFDIGSEPPVIARHLRWDDATKQEEAPVALVSNNSLLYSQDGTVTIRGETIPVIIYVYEQLGNPNITVIVWKSKAVGLPVHFGFSLANIAPVDVPLVQTNIPGLIEVATVA